MIRAALMQHGGLLFVRRVTHSRQGIGNFFSGGVRHTLEGNHRVYNDIIMYKLQQRRVLMRERAMVLYIVIIYNIYIVLISIEHSPSLKFDDCRQLKTKP